MYIVIGKPKSISTLNGHFEINLGKLRSATKVCIIDDEIFPKSNTLKTHDYNIKEIGDIKDINAIVAYQIILCDIKGVGRHFESRYEGGHIIEEINKYFPNKVILAYTGERLDPSYNKFLNIADRAVKKDSNSDEWVGYLDQAINIVHSPIEQWKKIRKRLLELSINSLDLLRAEDIYVQSYLQKSNLFKGNRFIERMPEDIRSILIDLASNFIFLAITG